MHVGMKWLETREVADAAAPSSVRKPFRPVRFHDQWFYIDATDTQSKRAFLFLQTFIGMRLADPGAAQRAPVITVPVN